MALMWDARDGYLRFRDYEVTDRATKESRIAVDRAGAVRDGKVRIVVGVQTFFRSTSRRIDAAGGLQLSAEEARALALAICPELEPVDAAELQRAAFLEGAEYGQRQASGSDGLDCGWFAEQAAASRYKK